MLPIYKEDKLSVEIITDCWSREIQPPRSWEELLVFLEGAFWRGELKAEPFTRLALLKSIFRSARAGDLTGLVFVTQENTTPPQGVKLPDGGLLFSANDLETRILVPSNDPEGWTEDSCASAFQVLAQTPSRRHYPDRTIQFLMMQICYNEFIRLLRANGLDSPKFWRPLVEKPPQEVEAEPQSTAGGSGPRPLPPAIAVKDKGGRPAKADWDALKDSLREQIGILGYPDSQKPPGWQRLKDVMDWIAGHRILGKIGDEVSTRTMEDNVRRILRELKPSGQK
jgi:hypothetical protein